MKRSTIALWLQAATAVAAVAGVSLAVLRPQSVAIVSVAADQSVAAERDSLRREVRRLRDSIRVSRAAAPTATDRSSVVVDSRDLTRESVGPKDHWALTAAKAFPVCAALAGTTVVTPLLFAGDVLLLPFGRPFRMLRSAWSFSWNTVTVRWFWMRGSPFGLVLGLLLVLTGDGISTRATRKRGTSSRGRAS